ncbi:unnamed protein product [Rotaria sp. Silwood1]|nr:unnamed protein product [Rotaria sp. Silwood1]
MSDTTNALEIFSPDQSIGLKEIKNRCRSSSNETTTPSVKSLSLLEHNQSNSFSAYQKLTIWKESIEKHLNHIYLEKLKEIDNLLTQGQNHIDIIFKKAPSFGQLVTVISPRQTIDYPFDDIELDHTNSQLFDLTKIPITVYTPLNVSKDKLVIYFHGGGWVVCSRKSHQAIVNSLADATKTIWISVEYRLGPEYKYPIWLDDALDVTQHIIQNKTAYGVNQTAKIGVAGDSAGGMISASISRLLKGIDFQILVYAALDILGETPSYKEFAKPMYFLTPELMKWYTTHAYHRLDDVKDPRVSALLNKTFEEYQKLLEKAGVQTKLVLMKGVVHAFFSLPGIFPQASAEAIDAIRDFMESI